VEFERVPTLLEFVDLQYHLADLLGVKVDLVMRKTLKPTIGQRILEKVVSV
jgi:predicted nucleotidyltransferase